MSSPAARLNAVIAALEKVRDHICEIDETEAVPASSYNRWVGMLEGVVEGDWKSLKLEAGSMPASQLLMHVDAAIAFLEGEREG